MHLKYFGNYFTHFSMFVSNNNTTHTQDLNNVNGDFDAMFQEYCDFFCPFVF